MSYEGKRRVYEGLVLPILLYSSECWSLREEELRLLDNPPNRGGPCSETPLPRTMGTYRNAGGRGLYT